MTEVDDVITKRMGRPPDAVRTRGVIVQTRAMPVERDAWARAARATGKTVAAWLRELANVASGRTKGR
jgi:hypothetical protein